MPDDVTGDYNVRECRGHWHVTVGDEDVSGQFTESEAREIAARRNAGETWESIESESCRIADDAPAPDAPAARQMVLPREYVGVRADELRELREQLAAAEARAVRCEGDAARLDWVLSRCALRYRVSVTVHGPEGEYDTVEMRPFTATRDAIDAVMR